MTGRRPDPALARMHAIIQAKLTGFIEGLDRTLRIYPESDRSRPARYARAIAHFRRGDIDRGLAEVDGLIGYPLDEAVPEMADLLDEIRLRPQRLVERQVRIRRDGEVRTLLVRIAADRLGGELRGYVVTFDDVTELLSAQRKAAWADGARRIAQEMKNPLTPIQLSAERLKRKYLKQIETDPETFVNCTDTIVRQVGDIGRMVDEFSAFARMPTPVMQPVDIGEICQQAIFLQRNAHPRIRFAFRPPPERIRLPGDARQLHQALTNLLQNALDAIQGRSQPPDGDLPPGRIDVSIELAEGEVTVNVDDNGKGLPEENRDRLTEPYVTTRTKGTGLGLAIVKKIMEDHGGRLILEDQPRGGARVRLCLPLERASSADMTVSDNELAERTNARERADHGA